MILGLLSTSSAVKNHWLAGIFVIGPWGGVPGACRFVGDCAEARLEKGARDGGELRDECAGGEGTAGGISRRLEGDLDERSLARMPLLVAFLTGGTYASRAGGGRY